MYQKKHKYLNVEIHICIGIGGGGCVMLLIHKHIPLFPVTKLGTKSESVWVKVFAAKMSHFVRSPYRPHSDENLTPL